MTDRIAKLILAAAAALLLLCAPAAAEPVLDLQLDRLNAPATHSDERLAYDLTVSNIASVNPGVGTQLTCLGTPEDGKGWFGNDPDPTFAYQWLRNGEDIVGATERTYVVDAADAGKLLQCKVTGTNDADGAGPTYAPISSSSVSLPPTAVEPVPSPAPLSGSSGSLIGGVATEGAELTCAPPSDWTGTGITWSLQWLRNGEPIPGATGPTYTVQSADTEPPSIIQCEAIGEDTGGSKAVSISSGVRRTQPTPPAPYLSPSKQSSSPVIVAFDNKTEGPVTVEAEFPAGTQVIRAFSDEVAKVWSCTKQPAPHPSTVECTRSDTLQPADSYPPIRIVAQVLADAPDELTTKFGVSGGGALNEPLLEDTVAGILPAVPFGFEAFEVKVLDKDGNDYVQAGGHPFSAGADVELKIHQRAEFDIRVGPDGLRATNGLLREVRTDTPAGFVGNPEAIAEKCDNLTQVAPGPPLVTSTCPAGSAVGGITLETAEGPFDNVPIWAIEPEFGTPAQFAFGISGAGPFTYTLTPELRPQDGYAITLRTAPTQKYPELFVAKVKLCSFGAKIGPNVKGGNNETEFKGCREAGEPGATERPFLTLPPAHCGDPEATTTRIYADTWEEPGNFAEASSTAPLLENCEAIEFEPELEAKPTTHNADSPSGLEVDLHIPQNEDPEGTATAHLKKTVVTLPEGLAVNPSGANGLGACSEAQLGMANGVPDNEPVNCPDASKLGSVSVSTPILDHPLPGALYLATPHQNPFNSLIALYLVVESPSDGITIKLPGRVQTNPITGQISSTFDQNPQAPVQDVKLRLRGGATASLRTPTECGRYETVSELTPWSAPRSGPPATSKDSWQIARGPGGGPCSRPQNSPSFAAGSASPIAGAFSPFVVELQRPDGSQRFSELSVSPPPGVLAKLAGTASCPDAALAAAPAKSGRAEQASPSCPPASELGNVVAAAGAGPAPFRAPGKAYLTGPYKGAPLSISIITPAVAGPFDLGTVVVRSAAHVDPATARVTVKSDPLPRILQGIPLDIRSATVSIDRPQFILNPTSCDPTAVAAQLFSTLGQGAELQSRFQLAECGRLGFKPRLKLRLKGKTRRGGYQAVRAVLRPRPGDANIARTVVRFPKSAFVAQEHIRTICTRVQWAADACPPGSVYGKALAITPLLDYPLRGKVYLRSSDNELPDAIADLRGPAHQPIRVEVAIRNDSAKGALRNTVTAAPDAPVSYFRLELFGGKKGLIVNSRNLCKGKKQRAAVKLGAHNGRALSLRPVVRNSCKGNKRKRVRRGGHARSR
jgi:hypothetical protein